MNEAFDQRTAAMISNTTLATIIQRNTNMPNLQANVFIRASLPTHVRPHVAPPAVVNTHGRKVPPFLTNGN
jgi:hypothetical protein